VAPKGDNIHPDRKKAAAETAGEERVSGAEDINSITNVLLLSAQKAII